MSCNKCDASKTQISLALNAGNFQITSLAMDGEAVAFSSTEDSIDRKYDSRGNILKAGLPIKRVTINARASCEGAIALWQSWKNPENDHCGSGSIIDDCCVDENYNTIDVVSMKRPNIGDSVDYFDIELLGVYQ